MSTSIHYFELKRIDVCQKIEALDCICSLFVSLRNDREVKGREIGTFIRYY